jgi:cobalamin biosynthesis protein CobT
MPDADEEAEVTPPTTKELDDFENPMEALKKDIELEHRLATKGGAESYAPYATHLDKIIDVEPADTLEVFDSLKASLGPINTMKKKVVNFFNSKQAAQWIGDREQGKINNRALARVHAGETRVFKEKFQATAKNTCASFLLDFSGSMDGRRQVAAVKSAILFVEALEEAGIKTEVLAYTTSGSKYSVSYTDDDEKEFYSRCGRVEPLRTYVFKTFADVYGRKIKARLANYRSIKTYNNCDGENVKIAYDRIRVRPEKRKILFVLTDGEVANAGNCSLGEKHLKKVCDSIAKEGAVELIGVDLESGHGAHYYPNVINVTNCKTLTDQLFNGIKEILK